MCLKQDIQVLLDKNGRIKPNNGVNFAFKQNPSLLQKILDRTSYLPIDTKLNERIYNILNDIYEIKKCSVCGKPVKYGFVGGNVTGYRNSCSIQCHNAKLYQKFLENMPPPKKCKGCGKQTQYYGGKWRSYCSPSCRSKDPNLIKKRLKSKKYLNKKEFKNLQNLSMREIANILGRSLSGCHTFCRKNKIKYKKIENSISSYELEIQSFLTTNNIHFIPSYKINKQEIDIFIPKYNLGIEFNGNYFHSAKFKDKDYHREKTSLCISHGITLLHIFEDEWVNKKDIWKSMILSRCNISTKIFARKCEIKQISDKTVISNFYDDNHLYGASRTGSIHYGLYYNNELLCMMSFAKTLYSKTIDCLELTRFCNKIGYTIIGGASRLFKYHLKTDQRKIITYADLRYSTGNMYEKLGFRFIKTNPPNYWYITPGQCLQRISRHRFMKHKITNMKTNKTEEQILKEKHYYRLYDCGHNKYEYCCDKKC